MHLHLLDFPEQVGCEDEVVEGFVVGGDDLVFCSLPFFNAFFDEDDVFPDIHYGVHVMGVDNRGHLIFRCNIVDSGRSISRDVLGSSPELGSSQKDI